MIFSMPVGKTLLLETITMQLLACTASEVLVCVHDVSLKATSALIGCNVIVGDAH